MALTQQQLLQIIEECRAISAKEHINKINNPKSKVVIPSVILNLVGPSMPLGPGNSAIFVNANTFRLFKGERIGWIKNQTIVLRESLLGRKENIIGIIGMIIHETGHVFNVAAGIANSETNAHIFEIEIMLKLYEAKSPLLFDSVSEVGSYFQSRLSQYQMGKPHCEHIAELIKKIKDNFALSEAIPSAYQPLRLAV